ncbi:hypothetical protein [Saccharopolyspora elongata]|nr:hypothetical protein [Saccharopolyspora elongata]
MNLDELVNKVEAVSANYARKYGVDLETEVARKRLVWNSAPPS